MASFRLFSGDPIVLNFQEGGTPAAFRDGDLVRSDSSGQVVLANAGNIIGIARKTYTGTQATVIPVELLDRNGIYETTAHNTLAQTDVGLTCDVVFTAGAQYVDQDGTTTKEVEIVALVDAVGTTSGGKILVRFNPTTILAR